MTGFSPGCSEFLLSFADDEHLMGQQHTEWIGVTPFLEEDLAFSSIGQDELGHAALLYELLVGDADADIDRLAFDRTPEQYRSCWLVELESTDWAEALVRHWLYDAAERYRWELMSNSSIPRLAELAVRAEREEVYHRRHADGLLDLLLASEDAATKLHVAAQRMAPLAVGIFDPTAGETEAVAEGLVSAPLVSQQGAWQTEVERRFGEIRWPEVGPQQVGRTVRSPDFAPLLKRMREVFELDLDATW